MELLGPIVEVMKWIGDLTWRYLNNHRKLEENVNDLRRKLNDLNIRKQDIESRKDVQLRRRKVVKKEVEKWFEDVQRMNALMERVEQELPVVSYLRRAGLGTLVRQGIEEAQEIYKQGCFPDGVAIDGPPAVGVTFQIVDLEGEADVKEQIWGWLRGNEVGMVGVCGMGGVGKTTVMKHINNQILKESQFDQVIWVNVSKEFNLVKLQEDIACALDYHLPKNELEWPTALMNILETKRFVMILDDVWERFSLLNVGIPNPTSTNGNKLVITSRSFEVCKSMGCEVLKVQPLSEEESFNLFLKHVGHNNVLQVPNLEETVKQIVQQCGGLPLAIVTIAGCMKGVDDDREWRNVLNELRKRVKSVKGMDVKIFECLKFSYDRLRDLKMQNCFLYCSLYPEDYSIKRKELMEKWIDEGLIDEFETRQAMYYRGHSILKKLENNCLLERGNNEDEVKMHDVLRDMGLFIIKSVGHQFMVKAGMQLKKLPGEHEWKGNLEKVSLMDNKISAIPAHISPKCHNLSTLLLQENYTLERISESFFEHMLGLKVLDLSNTGILDLPNSVSNLENLVALVLRNCDKLRHVCSLAKLRKLRKLDLFNTDINEVPQGIETLANLTYLCLYSNDLTELPMGILPMFSHLQYLATILLNIQGEEVAKLNELEILSGLFFELQDFEKYAKSIFGQWPNHYRLAVGSTSLDYSDYDHWFPSFENPELYEELCFINCQIGRENRLLLPNNLSTLSIEECHEFKSLSTLCSLHEVNELKTCSIWQCEGIECVIDLSLSSCNSLPKIERLSLGDLCNLSELVRVEVAVISTSHAQTQPAMFSSLKTLCLWSCSSMKNLFSLELLQGLQNLEHIQVVNCKAMEKIVASEETHQGEGEGATTNIATSVLPKLRELSLQYLPELKIICNGGVMISANCLEHLSIMDCSMLKKIPLSLPMLDNGQPCAPPSLGRITIGSREWWESVEWDDANAKDVLSPSVCFE
ncbi:probable disease resistance protein At4g27220 [Durio zibethinus]|uniref:Probable disease resistance protein At4g27220 n=1 Tax=Durio zibethinus TaxID=66656 RepID=A0A6P6AHW3_DURZI|nr:probable disease resistance protein At4g27220 [Durio zibethinus]XP_022764391.1 probable disease resistance protein At4g27220 [Durio zibethinus]XP_022764392.1 probable disease resistance protein At4g27220 [Durio zibethinus]XP_022764393.1 probable disease resistance protein At4g27220 [Durio zibethinus]